ncbi:MAG: undecaprenyl-phosphate galactose phosphotransferase WbaP [Chloroflexi bacterium HGW-Chloroflexi-8]|nr:MAG: undecaprenyl-phosphate galactose phosphotransferase WbaP [Chloroflexi bacterium HGW-Chloroflexi-8]
MEYTSDKISQIDIAQKTIKLSLSDRHSKLLMIVSLLISDLLAIFISIFSAVFIRNILPLSTNVTIEKYINLFPLIIFFVGIYAIRDLYNGIGVSPINELKNLTISTSLVFFLFTTLSFLGKTSETYSRSLFIITYVLALFLIPTVRTFIRWILIRMNIWGTPVVILGFGSKGQHILQYLRSNPHMGMRPFMVVNGNVDEVYRQKWQIPFLSFKEVKNIGVRTAILIPNEFSVTLRKKALYDLKMGFERLILISDLEWIGSSALISHDMQGVLGLEVEQNLLDPYQKTAKRILDLLLVVIGSIILFPFFLFIWLAIILDSKGPAIYKQARIGKNHKIIHIYKFRTMVSNAAEVLEDLLKNNCELSGEWDKLHKLKNDPRITRVGRFLRKTSLDELPQLINILIGEMSIVGPRPIVEDEIPHYKDVFELYKQVEPGLTGMWQVSGRSDTSYENRVQLDEYYIRHWSIWMDIYIIVKTFWILIKGKGAY